MKSRRNVGEWHYARFGTQLSCCTNKAEIAVTSSPEKINSNGKLRMLKSSRISRELWLRIPSFLTILYGVTNLAGNFLCSYLHCWLVYCFLDVSIYSHFQGYFDTARLELAEHNIGVQIICPGPVESSLSENAFSEDVDVVKINEFLNATYLPEICSMMLAQQ